MQVGIPDSLYYEEIEESSAGLEQLGLQIMEVNGDFVKYAALLPSRYNDYLALALAKQESCTLLTGDANLRIVAEKEQVVVRVG